MVQASYPSLQTPRRDYIATHSQGAREGRAPNPDGRAPIKTRGFMTPKPKIPTEKSGLSITITTFPRLKQAHHRNQSGECPRAAGDESRRSAWIHYTRSSRPFPVNERKVKDNKIF